MRRETEGFGHNLVLCGMNSVDFPDTHCSFLLEHDRFPSHQTPSFVISLILSIFRLLVRKLCFVFI
jgi:hypothetical protein